LHGTHFRQSKPSLSSLEERGSTGSSRQKVLRCGGAIKLLIRYVVGEGPDRKIAARKRGKGIPKASERGGGPLSFSMKRTILDIRDSVRRGRKGRPFPIGEFAPNGKNRRMQADALVQKGIEMASSRRMSSGHPAA